MKLLENKKMIIIGGSNGIGFATALKCLQEGAHVGITFHSSRERLVLLKDTADTNQVSFHAVQMDIQNPSSIRTGMQELMESLGEVDVLINSAGITRDRSFAFMNETDWDSVLDVNLSGVYRVIKKAILPMVAHKNGVILNVASVSGLMGIAGQANYCSAKAGLIGLTKALAREFGPYNIRVNAVAPGYIETDLLNTMSEEHRTKALTQIPLKRFGTPDEIADLLTFLASDKASYINGETIVIDGGLSH